MRTNQVPSNGSRSWIVLAVLLLLFVWVSPYTAGGEFQVVPALTGTLMPALVIWVEARRLLYWRRHRDYSAASQALRVASSELPQRQWRATPDGHHLFVFTARRFLTRYNMIIRIDVDEDLDVEGPASALVLHRFFQQGRRDHRVITFTGMTRCWPDGSEEDAIPRVSLTRALWNTNRMSRAGLLDVSVKEIQRLTRELEDTEHCGRHG